MSTTDKATLEEVRQALRKCGYEDVYQGEWCQMPKGRLWRFSDFWVDLNAIHELIDAACARFKCGVAWTGAPRLAKGRHLIGFMGEPPAVMADDFATAVIRAINQIPEVEGQ